MAGEGKTPPPPADVDADAQLFGLLSNLLQQVESLTNQEEVELRAKIETLGMGVRKLPSKSAQHLNEMEIAKELDILSTKMGDVGEMISSTMADDPQVQTLLSSTADIWLPVITATSDERRKFMASVSGEAGHESNGKSSE